MEGLERPNTPLFKKRKKLSNLTGSARRTQSKLNAKYLDSINSSLSNQDKELNGLKTPIHFNGTLAARYENSRFFSSPDEQQDELIDDITSEQIKLPLKDESGAKMKRKGTPRKLPQFRLIDSVWNSPKNNDNDKNIFPTIDPDESIEFDSSDHSEPPEEGPQPGDIPIPQPSGGRPYNTSTVIDKSISLDNTDHSIEKLVLLNKVNDTITAIRERERSYNDVKLVDYSTTDDSREKEPSFGKLTNQFDKFLNSEVEDSERDDSSEEKEHQIKKLDKITSLHKSTKIPVQQPIPLQNKSSQPLSLKPQLKRTTLNSSPYRKSPPARKLYPTIGSISERYERLRTNTNIETQFIQSPPLNQSTSPHRSPKGKQDQKFDEEQPLSPDDDTSTSISAPTEQWSQEQWGKLSKLVDSLSYKEVINSQLIMEIFQVTRNELIKRVQFLKKYKRLKRHLERSRESRSKLKGNVQKMGVNGKGFKSKKYL